MYGALRLITEVARDEERGATAVEYALMVALIALAIVAVVGVLGINVASIFGNPDLGGALS